MALYYISMSKALNLYNNLLQATTLTVRYYDPIGTTILIINVCVSWCVHVFLCDPGQPTTEHKEKFLRTIVLGRRTIVLCRQTMIYSVFRITPEDAGSFEAPLLSSVVMQYQRWCVCVCVPLYDRTPEDNKGASKEPASSDVRRNKEQIHVRLSSAIVRLPRTIVLRNFSLCSAC